MYRSTYFLVVMLGFFFGRVVVDVATASRGSTVDCGGWKIGL